MNDSDNQRVPVNAGFATTHWSVVLVAKEGESAEAAAALGRLCQTYWYPLYAFVRREGFDHHEAQDLTQEFFARLLERNFLRSVAQEKGRFRSFLLVALKHFLVNEWERARAQKRGGGRALIPLDEMMAEDRYSLEPADELTAEKIYERRWALTVLAQVLSRLRKECAVAGKTPQFEALKVFLSAEKSLLTYAELGTQLGLSQGGMKSAVSRLRERYRELLREEIAHTVAHAIDIEDELKHLISVLSR